MVQRCTNKNGQHWDHYGGRGISLDPMWLSFENFFSDMGVCKAGYSLERIDVNGNYQKDNCKWIPKEQQPLNTRRLRKVEFKGATKSIAVWCKELGLQYEKTYNRIRSGWTAERAFAE